MINNAAPETWVEVSKAEPCNICSKSSWCRRSPDGSVVACRRKENGKVHRYKDGSVVYIHKLRDDQPGENGRHGRGRKPKSQSNRTPETPGNSKNVDLFDRAYRLLIDELTLSDSHRQSLRDRGLSDDAIDSAKYRSLPDDCHQVALKLLMMLGSDFRQVPGFRNSGGPTRINSKPGLFIPVRNADDRLVAIKVKPDDPGPDKKYCYLTSRSKKNSDGPSPGSPIHVPFGVRGPCDEVRITEGELKADVVFHLTRMPTVSMPGVGSWQKSIPVIKQLGAKSVRLAFDADARTNEAVASAQRSLYQALVKLEYDVIVETWPLEAGKGIDDLLASGGRPEVLSGSAAKEYIETTCISSSEAQDIKVNEADDDPHRLARANLEHYRARGGEIIYFGQQFYRYKGTRYQVSEISNFEAKMTAAIKREFDRLNLEAIEAYNEWKKSEKYDPKNDKGIPVAKKVTTGLVKNVISATKSMTEVPESTVINSWIDREKRTSEKRSYMSLQNGLLDVDALLADKEIDEVLLPHSPHWFSTVTLPYRFDIDAKCPHWNNVIAHLMDHDQERINLLQEWAGYLLLPDTGEQKFMFLEGEGGNGKSVFMAAMEAMLGEENCSHVPLENFSDKFQLSGTLGKLANFCTDAPSMDQMAENLIKSFTSGERTQFDRKYLPVMDAYPTARLTVSYNIRPRFADRSEGIWRRMLLVPFNATVSPERRVKNMDKPWWWQKSGELPGILRWAIEGLYRLRTNGNFTLPVASCQAIELYREACSPDLVFVRERCELDPKTEVERSELYNRYKWWATDNGFHPVSSTTFGKTFHAEYPNVKTVQRTVEGARKRMYVGIKYVG